MRSKIDLNNRKATPELEDFKGKYQEQNPIAKKMLENYFGSVERLLKKIDISGKKALEVGCGEGLSTVKLHKMLGNNVELSASEYVDSLVKIAKQNNPNISIIEEDVYKLKREDNSFDLVFLLEVLEHLDYPEKALEELKRVSSKYLILGVPREPIWRFLNMTRLKYLNKLGNTPGHLNHWSTEGIVKFVNKNFGNVIAVEKPLPWTILLAEKT
jgi:ubiquinone/menaquinone biosynthesis C-methylase UbiE